MPADSLRLALSHHQRIYPHPELTLCVDEIKNYVEALIIERDYDKYSGYVDHSFQKIF